MGSDSAIKRSVRRIQSRLGRLEPYALLAVRLWIGANFILVHGMHKLHDPGKFLAGSALQKFPLPMAMGWFALLAETLGALLLLLGLATRVAAAGLCATMLGAGLVVHADDPWSKAEFAVGYAVMALLLAVFGPGAVALDRVLGIEPRRGDR